MKSVPCESNAIWLKADAVGKERTNVSVSETTSNVAKRLELKRKAEAAGIRMPSCPRIPEATLPLGKDKTKRAQDDCGTPGGNGPNTRSRLSSGL